MENSEASSNMSGSGFSFGQVQDTYYEQYKINDAEQTKLPYNPFLFDLNLIMIKSQEGYQKPQIQIELKNKFKNVFGRKPKKKVELLAGQQPMAFEFIAPTISRKHFAITNDHFLQDLGSKKGTFLWIRRHEPKLLQIGDQFLLNQTPFCIHNINKQNQKIQIQLDTKQITLNPKLFKERMFIIGSHPKCNFTFQALRQFHIGIDLNNLNLYNLIQDEDCDNTIGTWMKVKDQVKIQGGDIFMAFPYVFRVDY